MANVNVRIDADIKRNAEKVFASLGISASTAINMFYKQVIRTNSIPFELKAADIPNKETIKALKEAEKIEKNNTGKSFHSADELMRDLLKD